MILYVIKSKKLKKVQLLNASVTSKMKMIKLKLVDLMQWLENPMFYNSTIMVIVRKEALTDIFAIMYLPKYLLISEHGRKLLLYQDTTLMSLGSDGPKLNMKARKMEPTTSMLQKMNSLSSLASFIIVISFLMKTMRWWDQSWCNLLMPILNHILTQHGIKLILR